MIRLAVRVRREDAEVVLAQLLDLAPDGFEEREEGDVVEYAVYGAGGELPSLPALRAAVGAALVEVRTSEVPDDWHERWRAFHRPVTVGGRLHVRPPWEPAPPAASGGRGLVDVVVDPGQAFGTGAHPTTRLCLALLLELEPAGGFLDLGCGSGVLAIAAAKLGWVPVLGLDHEQESVDATRENAERNGARLRAERFDLLRDGPAPSAPTVAANLLRPLLLHLADAGVRGAPPRTLVASGLLREEADEVSTRLAAGLGLYEAARREEGEWAALLLRAREDGP